MKEFFTGGSDNWNGNNQHATDADRIRDVQNKEAVSGGTAWDRHQWMTNDQLNEYDRQKNGG